MTFLNPLERADSKNPIFIFCRFMGLGHLRGLGVSLGRILGVHSVELLLGGGGGSGQGLYRPPPLRLKACLPEPLWHTPHPTPPLSRDKHWPCTTAAAQVLFRSDQARGWAGLPNASAVWEALGRPDVRIGVNAGGTNQKEVEARLPRTQIHVYPYNGLQFMALMQGKVDAVVTDDVCRVLVEERGRGGNSWLFLIGRDSWHQTNSCWLVILRDIGTVVCV